MRQRQLAPTGRRGRRPTGDHIAQCPDTFAVWLTTRCPVWYQTSRQRQHPTPRGDARQYCVKTLAFVPG